MNWFRYFNKYIRKCQIKLYDFLVLDSYSSYLTYKLWSYTEEYNIILFCLSLHFIYLTQLLNINCF